MEATAKQIDQAVLDALRERKPDEFYVDEMEIYVGPGTDCTFEYIERSDVAEALVRLQRRGLVKGSYGRPWSAV